MSDVDQARDDAEKYARAMMGALSVAAGRDTLDARSVALACAQIAGSYAFGVPAEIRAPIVRHWAETMFKFADVPLLVVVKQ